MLAAVPQSSTISPVPCPRARVGVPFLCRPLRGASSIPIILFEAFADFVFGSVDMQLKIALQDQELVEELWGWLAQATPDLCQAWFVRYQKAVSSAQPPQCETSNYLRRRPADSQLYLERPSRSISLFCVWSIMRVSQYFPFSKTSATMFW